MGFEIHATRKKEKTIPASMGRCKGRTKSGYGSTTPPTWNSFSDILYMPTG